MAKKQMPEEEPVVDLGEGTDGEIVDPNEALGALDFNVTDEYKAPPLIPQGVYHGVVTKVAYIPARSAIVWDICLQDNGGLMNDGQTEIDGSYVQYNNWLPKPGDENELTKKGNMSKRQSKINSLQDFQVAMGINMSTPNIIATSLAEQVWIGLEVDVTVSVSEYNGRYRNQGDRMVKRVV